MKKSIITAVIVLASLPLMAQGVPGAEAAILKTLNNTLETQVRPITFRPYATVVTKKILKNQLDKYFPIIKEVVNTVNEKLPGYVVQVTGYANPPKGHQTQEAKDKALELSKKRAWNVRAALIKRGLKARVLTARGLADKNQISSNPQNQEEWAKNRRVVLKIVKK